MTKAISAPLQTHLDGTSLKMTWLWKMTRADGQVFGFTNNDRDITADIDGEGQVTYSASTGGMTPTAVRNTGDMAVDNLSIKSHFDSLAITEQDLILGRWDNAEVKIALVRFDSVGDGTVRLRKGNLGELTHDLRALETELRGLVQRYSQQIGDLTQPLCRRELGDAKCKVQLSPPTWAAETEYTLVQVGDEIGRDAGASNVVQPTAFNDRYFRLVTAGFTGATEPTWDTTIGNTTTESLTGISDWAATTAYAQGDVVRPTTPNGFLFVANNAGTSGGTEPTWPTTEDATVGDNDITWTARPEVAAAWQAERALEIQTTLVSFANDRELTVAYSGDAQPADLENGRVRFTSGDLLDTWWEIKSWDDVTKTATLYLPLPIDPTPTDTLTMQFGCVKTGTNCKRFGNIFNMRAERFLPGNDAIFRTPNART